MRGRLNSGRPESWGTSRSAVPASPPGTTPPTSSSSSRCLREQAISSVKKGVLSAHPFFLSGPGLKRAMGRSARCRRGHRRRERNDRVLQVKCRRLLIRTRDGEKLPFLEEAAQKRERYGGAIIPETVGKNNRWMPGKIGGNELRKIRRARGADDNVD